MSGSCGRWQPRHYGLARYLAGIGQQVSEIEELDAQILSSDLPIDAYLDQGFRNWLAHEEN